MCELSSIEDIADICIDTMTLQVVSSFNSMIPAIITMSFDFWLVKQVEPSTFVLVVWTVLPSAAGKGGFEALWTGKRDEDCP